MYARPSLSSTRILLCLSLVAACSSAQAQTQPKSVCYQINTAHTGSTTMSRFLPPLRVRWTQLLEAYASYPIIANGRIFVTTGQSGRVRVYALDQASGAILWNKRLFNVNNSRANIAYDAGLVFAVTDKGHVSAMNEVTGATVWERTLTGQYFTAAPTAWQGKLYFSAGFDSGPGILYALRTSDGATLWTRSVEWGFNSSPTVTGGGVIVSYAGPKVYRLDPISGGLIWWSSNSTQHSRGGTTTVTYGDSFYAHNGESIYRYRPSPSGGVTFYTLPLMGLTTPTFDNNRVFLVDRNGIEARSVADLVMDRLWYYAPSPPIEYPKAPPIVINGIVYASFDPRNIKALDPASGQVLWNADIGGYVFTPNEWSTDWVQFGLGAGEGILVAPTGKTVVCLESAPYAILATPPNVTVGDNLSIQWYAPDGRPPLDWIGFFRKTGSNRDWIDYRYTNGAAGGTFSWKAPLEPGEYEFRYLLDNGYTSTAASNTITVSGVNATLTATPAQGTPGITRLTVNFTAPSGRPGSDWIGLYKVGEPNQTYRWWSYTNGATSGSFSMVAPPEPGTYEFRYLVNNSYDSVAASNTVTLSALDPSQFTLHGAPSTVSAGGPLSVSFTAPAGRSIYDWISLFKVGDPNRSYGWWRYTNGAESGTFDLTAPLEPGQYEFRYLLEDGYTHIKVSNTVTVQ